ncbi:ABC transporter permease [Candidatus Rhodobacter oscarellae]|uniref:ABC transporter permease n=1 Tax=Candidatus Rhodobacter oscarellae TaxID=1675527 RepID=UPI00190FDF63|nr:ABC transporter permease [Candidatus Rhodobacter lobularis]
MAVFLFFAIFGQITFLSAAGAASWLNVAATIGIVALPVGLLMIAGELDISIGSMIPASSMIFAISSGYFELPIGVGIAAALCFGLLVGFINGYLTLRTGVHSLIVTLGTLFAVAGLTLTMSVALTGTTSVAVQSPPFIKATMGDFINGIYQVTIFWWMLWAIVLGFVLHFSPIGNWILALGGDKESARNAGIPTQRLTIGLFALSSFSAAFVGVNQAILFNSAQVSAGMSYIFNTIVCVVVGGVLLTGGYGTVVGIVLGTMTFSIVNQGIYFTSFNANLASLIIGVLTLAAVVMNNSFRQMALTYAPKKAEKKAEKAE